jgi:hypothetical protein
MHPPALPRAAQKTDGPASPSTCHQTRSSCALHRRVKSRRYPSSRAASRRVDGPHGAAQRRCQHPRSPSWLLRRLSDGARTFQPSLPVYQASTRAARLVATKEENRYIRTGSVRILPVKHGCNFQLIIQEGLLRLLDGRKSSHQNLKGP